MGQEEADASRRRQLNALGRNRWRKDTQELAKRLAQSNGVGKQLHAVPLRNHLSELDSKSSHSEKQENDALDKHSGHGGLPLHCKEALLSEFLHSADETCRQGSKGMLAGLGTGIPPVPLNPTTSYVK